MDLSYMLFGYAVKVKQSG